LYQVGAPITPDQAMRLAIEEAKRGRGFVSPNPLVGCVIVDSQHRFLSSGAHLKCGEGHAEVNALDQAESPDTLKNASVYVTLEPCAHEGRTGSCAKRLAQLPIQRVYYGLKDPNPLVAGGGIKILEAANKLVRPFDKYQMECTQLIEQFSHHIQHQSPYIAFKIGASLDGQIALKTGESQWITGEEARRLSRQMRAYYDATMIGAGTLEYDNPTLDFRDTPFVGKKENRIIILDPKGKLPEVFAKSRLAEVHARKNIFVLTRAEHKSRWASQLVPVIDWEASRAGWEKALKNLYQKGISSIFVEGGAYVFGQLLTYHLAHKLYLFQSAKILGDGVSWSRYYQLDKLEKALTLKNWQSLTIGEDRLNTAYFI
jgi:diaminohydroxyphosphoribosylaminopyrimidine deaminase / 5-amino-6-(5-phosphoribosylamino)uracil reductase